ncbi:alkaline phosphatase family protein [Methylovirgula sp. HY1]|uniref:alkaline phosphatase family protein n=1 Tax=Methylovirgula sp. HY1 TaxID=2822761 RepID=UPI001C7721A6|nr:alkaline phosphatase family protein [Methylovirgula sp. HY1]QXX76278.1 Phospholipase C 2 [Methylovirgula sp. HY1]
MQKMHLQPHRNGLKNRLVSSVTAAVITAVNMAPISAMAEDSGARTPIKHVIVIIGENRSFDHVFATYQPVRGQKIWNLLSEHIVNADGTPGPEYKKFPQMQATNTVTYQDSPANKTPYSVLPPALSGGPATPYVCQLLGVSSGTSCDTSANEAAAQKYENGLAPDYYKYLLTGGTGQPSNVPDARINYDGHNASNLAPGPYQLTSGSYPYDAYAASPVHRFFQMWQEMDCGGMTKTAERDDNHRWGDDNHRGRGQIAQAGCKSDLFPWVEATEGAGSNGKAPPASPYTVEGSTSMGFFNMQQGDAPYLKQLADTYAMSDNYHQGAVGGTGANHVIIGTGDAIWFSDGRGNADVPPHNTVDPKNPGTPLNGTSALSEVENPNPQPGTNNFYTQDGYGGGSGSPTATAPNANYGGGSYVNCADPSQPGVASILHTLSAQPHSVAANCQAGHYYLLNNYNPGYFGDGTNAFTDTNAHNYVFTIPPSSVRNIGDALNQKNISWAYFGDQFDAYLNDKYQLGFSNGTDEYCNICNWASYSTSIMTNPAVRTAHLKDTTDLYAGIKSGQLPAVSYVKPSGLVDGHPGSSKLVLFEGFVKKIVDGVKANPTLWNNTAIFVTFDEGGGYWDSGYVQPLDFFGDGTRIPMIVVSKYAMGGHISHTYNDHVSILKFIEANWNLPPVTARSRDNLPNPISSPDNPYVPENGPAIGNMMDLFHFDNDRQ